MTTNEGKKHKLFVGTLVATDSNSRLRQLRAIFWLVAIVLGALVAWAGRYKMNPDGISFLDMGCAYFRGDWDMAINAYWSPFYPWLLGLALWVLRPSPYWEFPVVHLVNFVIYLLTLCCFEFFLRGAILCHQRQAAREGYLAFPEWTWLALGYSLFIWSSLLLIGVLQVTPDMCVAALVYLASGILLRIHMGSTGWPTFIPFGLILGLGYLAKAAMFPLAFVFLGVGMFNVGNLRRAVPRVLVALFMFLLVGGPFIATLSKAKGRLTFGDAGRLSYLWCVNGDGYPYIHWRGELSRYGTPIHPTRKIFDVPAVFEFGTPCGGTYPLWYDPTYWLEGVKPHFDWKRQIKRLMLSARAYYRFFTHSEVNAVLIAGFLILFLMSGRQWLCIKDLSGHWHLFIPAIAGLGMYSLVSHLDLRYIGAFVVLLWMGVLSGVRLPDSQESRRLAISVTFALVSITMLTTTGLTIKVVMEQGTGAHMHPAGDITWERAFPVVMEQGTGAHMHWRVADGLARMGVNPGDKVASIGASHEAYWARLARVRIVAEIPVSNYRKSYKDLDDFWMADPSVKSQVIQAFARTGAKVIVADRIPEYASATGWQRIGNTDYYAYLLGEEVIIDYK